MRQTSLPETASQTWWRRNMRKEIRTGSTATRRGEMPGKFVEASINSAGHGGFESPKESRYGSHRKRNGLQGWPPYTQPGSNERLAKDMAVMTASVPTVTPGATKAPAPTQTPSSTTIGA